MRWSRILIFSLSAALSLQITVSFGQKISVAAGIYDFTDRTTREIYLLSPIMLAGYDAWNKNQLHLKATAGVSFKSLKYNSHRHYLYMVPLMATCYYDLANSGTMVNPYIGMGVSLMGKADQNKDFDKTHYSFTYGYHATGGLKIKLSPKFILTFEITWNGLMPPVPEEVDLKGVMVTTGVRF